MSIAYVNLQPLIDNCDSFADITNLIISCDYKNYKINKTFNCISNLYYMKLTNIENVQNSEILCSSESTPEYISLDMWKQIIFNEPQKNLETINYLCFHFNGNNEGNFSENDKVYLGKRYAAFIRFFFEKFNNASELFLSNEHNINLYIIENMKSDKIKQLSTLYMDDIIMYDRKWNFSKSDIFSGLTNLNKICLATYKNDTFYTSPEMQNSIRHFLDYLVRKGNITLNLYYELCQNNITLILKILNYCETIGLDVKTNQEFQKNIYFEIEDYNFTTEALILKNRLSKIHFSITNIYNLNALKLIINSMDNLEDITIHFDPYSMKRIYEKISKFEDSDFYFKNFFNYTTALKKLTSLTISFNMSNYLLNLTEMSFGEICLLSNFFMEFLLFILPISINSLTLSDIVGLTMHTFNKIALQLPLLDTISFVSCGTLPVQALSHFIHLRNVIFYDVYKISIPSWIEIVIYCFFNKNFYYDQSSIEINNKEYFNMMEKNFKVLLKCLEDDKIHYIAFLTDFLNWRKIYYLLNRCDN